MDPDNPEVKNLTCAVCLEIFTNPKFLPCHHTYCAQCIADLARRRPGKPFKCPSCRKEVTLPQGGVDALQHNFYIKQEDLDKASRGVVDVTKCTMHAQQVLDMFCVDCDQLVCFKCVVTKHKEHNMKDLADVAIEADTPGNLTSHKANLDVIVERVAKHVEKQKQEQVEFEAKMAAIKKNLQDRHDTIVAAAKKYLEEALDHMHKVMDDVHNEVVMNAKFSASYHSTLTRLRKVLESAINTKSKAHIVEADRDMRVGFGANLAVDELLSQRHNTVHRPALSYTVFAGPVMDRIKEYFGTVHDRLVEVQDPPEFTVTEKFRCGDGFDTEIFSICPKDNSTLAVSYQRRALSDSAPSEGFDERGRHQYTRREATGMATWKCRGNGKGVFVGQLAAGMRTYSKGQNSQSLLRLDSSAPGLADIKKESILCEEPYKSKLSREGHIKCGLHRAFDVDPTHSVFAVLEEPASDKDIYRKVVLYHKNSQDSVDTYSPQQPTDFLASDVCFCKLGPDHVLVVADEWNDSLNILDYQGGKLTWRGLLAAGSSLIVQPIALNVDIQDRLWVACRGGAILTVEHKSSSIDPAPPPPTPATK